MFSDLLAASCDGQGRSQLSPEDAQWCQPPQHQPGPSSASAPGFHRPRTLPVLVLIADCSCITGDISREAMEEVPAGMWTPPGDRSAPHHADGCPVALLQQGPPALVSEPASRECPRHPESSTRPGLWLLCAVAKGNSKINPSQCLPRDCSPCCSLWRGRTPRPKRRLLPPFGLPAQAAPQPRKLQHGPRSEMVQVSDAMQRALCSIWKPVFCYGSETPVPSAAGQAGTDLPVCCWAQPRSPSLVKISVLQHKLQLLSEKLWHYISQG